MLKDGKSLLVTAFEKEWEKATLVLIEKGADFADNNAVTIIQMCLSRYWLG
jgi:hypothetical protein